MKIFLLAKQTDRLKIRAVAPVQRANAVLLRRSMGSEASEASPAALRCWARRRVKRAPGERSEPRRVVGLGGERSEPRRIAGRDFVRLILSFALGFVRVSFPRAIAVGFSFSRLTAASEMSDPRAEVRPALLWRLHTKPRRASRPLRRLRITRGASPRRGIASPRPRRSDGKFLKILLIANQTDRLKIGAVTRLGAILCWLV